VYHKHKQSEANYLTERPKEHFRTEGTGNVLHSRVATVYNGATEKHVCTEREHRRDFVYYLRINFIKIYYCP